VSAVPAVAATPTRATARPWHLTLARGRVSLLVHRRPLFVGLALFLVVVALFCTAMIVGGSWVPIGDIVKALTGNGTRGTDFVVLKTRLPRAVLGLATGAALGIAGALFQSVTRNPLASPDVIGVQAGAATGALTQIIVFGATGGAVVFGAFVGGIVAVGIVLLVIPLRQAGGFRFVLVGIAVAALANGLNEFLTTRTSLTSALRAAIWQTGSLNNAKWPEGIPVYIALGVLVPIAIWIAAGLRTVALGDDLASSLGVPVTRVRLTALFVAVLLTVAATAGAGPMLFVALAAGQIAERLMGRPGPSIAGAAMVGAALVVASDLVAARVFPQALPAGVVTGVLGGAYLAFLLARMWRTR
jgi:iron complex transport system permease protein